MDGIIQKTMAGREDGPILMVDTIKHEGALWLVSEWANNYQQGFKSPKFMSRLTGHRYSVFGPESKYPAQYFLEEPLPIPFLRGESSPGWPVVVGADIKFRILAS